MTGQANIKDPMQQQRQRVAVVGASPKAKRYSNQAVRLLIQHGHEVVPIHPAVKTIEGLPVVPRVADLDGHVDTLTLYVSPDVSITLADAIVDLHPDRVLFNPGTENAALQELLATKGIHCEAACTLVLLNTGQFQETQPSPFCT